MPAISEESSGLGKNKYYYYNNSLRRAIGSDLAIKPGDNNSNLNNNINSRDESPNDTEDTETATTSQLLQTMSISAPIASSEGSSSFSIANSVDWSSRACDDRHLSVSGENSTNRIQSILSSNVTDGIGISKSPRTNSLGLTGLFVEERHQSHAANGHNHLELPQSRVDDSNECESDCVSLNDSISSASNTALKLCYWNCGNSNENKPGSVMDQTESNKETNRGLNAYTNGINGSNHLMATAQKIGREIWFIIGW